MTDFDDQVSTLPPRWRNLPTHRLRAWLDDLQWIERATDGDYDDVLEEIDGREAQADANRGVMNGLPPEGPPS